MYTPPPDLDERDVARALRDGWEFDAVSLTYAPVGFGSHHWTATDASGDRRFVTVDELTKLRAGRTPDVVFARLSAAFETARALHDQGLEFVVAGTPGGDGRVLHRLGGRFAVALFPFVQGRTSPTGEFRSDAERRGVAALLDRLHGATAAVDGIAGREDFALPCRPALDAALAGLDAPWTAGPFAERARCLLARVAPDVVTALTLYDRLVDEVRGAGTPMVVTHGEPHAGNVMWTAGGPRLVDWDTTLIAPRGRDLWQIEPPGYPAATDDVEPSTLLYRLWYDLAEIGEYVARFRTPHDTTDDTLEAWKNLEHFARLRDHWGDRLVRS